MNDGINQKQEAVILVHGFNNDESDMFPLKWRLENLGYDAITVNLPLRFSPLEDCIAQFESDYHQVELELGPNETVHLVGYSMGGLVVRSFLARNIVSQLGRCVLIATPNRGTKLADISERVFKPLGRVYKPIKSLTTNCLEIGIPLNSPPPEIGVIAGNISNLFLGVFLGGDNDGRVEIESAKYEEMVDFIIEPYGHKEIHHQPETAKLVDLFLKTGKFSA